MADRIDPRFWKSGKILAKAGIRIYSATAPSAAIMSGNVGFRLLCSARLFRIVGTSLGLARRDVRRRMSEKVTKLMEIGFHRATASTSTHFRDFLFLAGGRGVEAAARPFRLDAKPL